VIKLLKAFYSVTDDTARRVDISKKLVLRMLDEDDTVKDLSVKTMEELWFQTTSNQKTKGTATSVNPHDKGPLLSKVAVIMGTAANFKDRQSPLEDMLHKIMVDKERSEAAALHKCYVEICETLIDGLVDASDLPGFVRPLSLFVS
jgi:cohesin loading factor subunit SCC2